EFLHECREIGRVSVHVIAGPGLARAPVTAPIVRNVAVPLIREDHHLVFPRVAVKWRAVAEDDWLAGPPVFEEDFGAVADGDGVTRSGHGPLAFHHISPLEQDSRSP